MAANYFDGFHTAGIAVANAAHCLLSDPSAVERVRRDPSLAAAAFTEGTRVAAPLMLTTRMALDDVEHDGLRIPAGTPVTMVWIAGNRDPEVFDEPGRTASTASRGPGRRSAAVRASAPAAARPGCSARSPCGRSPRRPWRCASTTRAPGTGWVPGSAIRHRGASTVAVRGPLSHDHGGEHHGVIDRRRRPRGGGGRVRLVRDGLVEGTAGNVSVREGDLVAVSPSSIAYERVRPEDVCVLDLDGTVVSRADGPRPSTETGMHLRIYRETDAVAVVHHHGLASVAVSTVVDVLPALHYYIARLGGPVRVAAYARTAPTSSRRTCSWPWRAAPPR